MVGKRRGNRAMGRRKIKAKNDRSKNRYCRYAKLSEYLFLRILRAFTSGQSATQAATGIRVSLRTINAVFVRLRERVVMEVAADERAFAYAGFFIRSLCILADATEETFDAGVPIKDKSAVVRALSAAPAGLGISSGLAARIGAGRIRKSCRHGHAVEILVRICLRYDFGKTGEFKQAIVAFLNHQRALDLEIKDYERLTNNLWRVRFEITEHRRLLSNYQREIERVRQQKRSRHQALLRRDTGADLFFEELRCLLLGRPL